jgi:hypothetical protein
MFPPPVFPDVVHVANGCYVSAAVYLVKFSAAFPAERGEAAPFVLPNADGTRQPHTLAIVSWQGEWWARDEYFGVVPLGCPSTAPWDPQVAQRRADAGFRRQLEFLRRTGGEVRRETAPPPRQLTAEWRLAEIQAARGCLPFPSEIHWLHEGRASVPFLYFRPGGDSFAVYDPAIGTASALSPVRDGSALVAAVAERMGYARHQPAPGRHRAAAPPPAGVRQEHAALASVGASATS